MRNKQLGKLFPFVLRNPYNWLYAIFRP